MSKFDVKFPGLEDKEQEGAETYTVTVGKGTGTITDSPLQVASVTFVTVPEGSDLMYVVNIGGVSGRPLTYLFSVVDVSTNYFEISVNSIFTK